MLRGLRISARSAHLRGLQHRALQRGVEALRNLSALTEPLGRALGSFSAVRGCPGLSERKEPDQAPRQLRAQRRQVP